MTVYHKAREKAYKEIEVEEERILSDDTIVFKGVCPIFGPCILRYQPNGDSVKTYSRCVKVDYLWQNML